MKLQFKGVLGKGSETQDSGMARIQTFLPEFGEGDLFLRLQSWDEGKKHSDWQKLAGKKLRITVEVVDE